MSSPFIFAKDGAEEIMVDPDSVRINAAGTNMTVATYSEKRFNRGDKRPEYKTWRSVSYNESDLKKMEEIFKNEQKKIKEKTKVRSHLLRNNKKVGRENLVLASRVN